MFSVFFLQTSLVPSSCRHFPYSVSLINVLGLSCKQILSLQTLRPPSFQNWESVSPVNALKCYSELFLLLWHSSAIAYIFLFFFLSFLLSRENHFIPESSDVSTTQFLLYLSLQIGNTLPHVELFLRSSWSIESLKMMWSHCTTVTIIILQDLWQNHQN